MKNLILMERLEARDNKAVVRILCIDVCLPVIGGPHTVGLVFGGDD